MVQATPRYALPFILPGQAQKEAFHNEALSTIDLLLHGAVEEIRSTPPGMPEEGQCWIVGPSPSGAWSGRAAEVVGWTAGGWRFVAPAVGMSLWDKVLDVPRRWDGAAWVASLSTKEIRIDGQKVVGTRQPGVASPSGGTIIDAEARAAVDHLIVALRSHGLID